MATALLPSDVFRFTYSVAIGNLVREVIHILEGEDEVYWNPKCNSPEHVTPEAFPSNPTVSHFPIVSIKESWKTVTVIH